MPSTKPAAWTFASCLDKLIAALETEVQRSTKYPRVTDAEYSWRGAADRLQEAYFTAGVHWAELHIEREHSDARAAKFMENLSATLDAFKEFERAANGHLRDPVVGRIAAGEVNKTNAAQQDQITRLTWDAYRNEFPGEVLALMDKATRQTYKAITLLAALKTMPVAATSAPADAAPPSSEGKKAVKEASSGKETRVWTADYCPVPGCGQSVEYIAMSDYERRTGTKGETVKGRILKRTYCHDGDFKVPWCLTHKERTPLGQGAEKPVEPAPAYKPTPEEVRVIWLQCADLLNKRTGLPKPDIDEADLDAEPTAGSPRELVQAGVTAALVRAAEVGHMLRKDEVEEVAGPVMKKEDTEDYRSRNHPQLRDPRIDFHSAPQRAGAADRDRPKESPGRKKSSK